MVRWGAQVRSPTRRAASTAPMPPSRVSTQLLAALPPPPAEAGLRRRLRLDRLVALRDRVRMQEAAEEGEALSADGPLPAYAEEAYADALLYLRRPEAARDAYERVLAQIPRTSRRATASSTPPSNWKTSLPPTPRSTSWWPTNRSGATTKTIPRRYDNPERAPPKSRRRRRATTAISSARRGTASQNLSDAAPANSNARLAALPDGQCARLAAARRGGGRDRRQPGAATIVGSKIALIEVAIANYRFADAQRMMAELLALYPEDQARATAGARTRRQAPLAVRSRGPAQQLRRRRRQRLGPGD